MPDYAIQDDCTLASVLSLLEMFPFILLPLQPVAGQNLPAVLVLCFWVSGEGIIRLLPHCEVEYSDVVVVFWLINLLKAVTLQPL